MQIKITSKGNFESTKRLMEQYAKVDPTPQLKKCGDAYRKALKANSPKDTGELAEGWDYEISKSSRGHELNMVNGSHKEWPGLIEGLEYGHGTGTGGYVPGTRFVGKSFDSADSEVSKMIEKVITDAK